MRMFTLALVLVLLLPMAGCKSVGWGVPSLPSLASPDAPGVADKPADRVSNLGHWLGSIAIIIGFASLILRAWIPILPISEAVQAIIYGISAIAFADLWHEHKLWFLLAGGAVAAFYLLDMADFKAGDALRYLKSRFAK